MQFKEVQGTLQKLTQSKVSLTEIGKALGIKLSTVSTRIKNGSELKYSEIKKIEKHFGKSLSKENNFMQSSLTHKHPKIKAMLDLYGMPSYGVYWALIETITKQGITVGEESALAKELNIDVDFMKSILLTFDLFYVKNGKYYSTFAEHQTDDKHFFTAQFEDVKDEILKEVEEMLKKKGIN